jgi:hypothetical protein
LFVVVEIALNASVFFGSIALLWGMLVIKRRYRNKLPSVETFRSSVIYSFPSRVLGVVNGGFTQEYSHSWNIPSSAMPMTFCKWRADVPIQGMIGR